MREPADAGTDYDPRKEPGKFAAKFADVIQAVEDVEAAVRRVLWETPAEVFPPGRDPTMTDILINTLGRVCVEEFREIQILCAYGMGNAAGRLLRGQFERVVTIGYLINHPQETTNFVAHWDAVRGRHLSHLRDALGDGMDVISPEDIERIRAKAEAAKLVLPRDGSVWSRLSVPDMAMKAGPPESTSLRSLYYDCYFVPTQHVHATLESTEAYLDQSSGKPRWRVPQRERAARVFSLSHQLVILVLEMNMRYFRLPYRDVLLNTLMSRYVEVWKKRHEESEGIP